MELALCAMYVKAYKEFVFFVALNVGKYGIIMFRVKGLLLGIVSD